MAALKIDGVNVINKSGSDFVLSDSCKFPAGHIIQIRSNTITKGSYDDSSVGVYNSTSTSINWVDIHNGLASALSHTITPQTGNHVYVRASVCIGAENGYQWDVRLVRGSTAICVGDASGGKPRATFGCRYEHNEQKFTFPVDFLDTSPGGDGSTAITYKFQWTMENNGRLLLNHSYNDSDQYNRGRGASTITLMEIQA